MNLHTVSTSSPHGFHLAAISGRCNAFGAMSTTLSAQGAPIPVDSSGGTIPQELPNIRELAAEYVRGLDQATGGVRGMDSVIEAMTHPHSTTRDTQQYGTSVPADETGEAIQIALHIDPSKTQGPMTQSPSKPFRHQVSNPQRPRQCPYPT